MTREVHFTPGFWARIEQFFPPERPDDGSPSRTDFINLDLFPIRDVFAARWDDLPELHPGNPRYRIFWLVGRLVARISVVGQLRQDGAIELISIEIQREMPPGMADEEPSVDI